MLLLFASAREIRSVQVRLMLVLAPAACGLGAVALSNCLDYVSVCLRASPEEFPEEPPAEERRKSAKSPKKCLQIMPWLIALMC